MAANFLTRLQSALSGDRWGIREKNELARFLQCTPEAFDAFEGMYQSLAVDPYPIQKQYASDAPVSRRPEALDSIQRRIVESLLSQTETTVVKDGAVTVTPASPLGPDGGLIAETNALPLEWRPMLTGTACRRDINGEAWPLALGSYKDFRETGKPMYYHMFRQGLDMQDLDPVLYGALGLNPNSMEHWLPQAAKAAWDSGAFKVPGTTFIRVPLTALQMSRLQYETLNRATMEVIDAFAMEAFRLDTGKDYFVKTGVFSSKFDFRNAHVPAGQEVRELGEYLLAISNQASLMAGYPLSGKGACTYGTSTTRTWAVREWIPDMEGNPTIYRGLPLRTEYRCFVDFDTREVLAVAPYWDPETMKHRFAHMEDRDTPDMRHDYVVYKAHEPVLMGRFEHNKEAIRSRMEGFLAKAEGLTGQWSVDIMQNGQDFWLIDMATADTSALSHYVPEGKLKKREIDWRPRIPELD